MAWMKYQESIGLRLMRGRLPVPKVLEIRNIASQVVKYIRASQMPRRRFIFIIIGIISISLSCFSANKNAIKLHDEDSVVYAPGNPYYHLSTCSELGTQRFNISVYAAKLKGLAPCPKCIIGYSTKQLFSQANSQFRIKPIGDDETVYISPSDKSFFHKENCVILANGK